MEERELGETGLSEALERLRSRLEDSAHGDPLISVAESLEWLYVLDEFHKRLGKDTYLKQQAASVEGKTEAGLVFARGRFVHSLTAIAHLVRINPGNVRIGTSPGERVVRPLVSEYRWRRVVELPGWQGAAAKRYELHVEGRPVLDPLEIAAGFILGV